MRFHGISELRAILGRPLAAPADGAMGGSGYSKIFPGPRADARGRQIEDTWASLVVQLREPVDTTLRGGMSAGDIAYRLGELVHNYFRTRGVTLTSFELRRIVVALLDNYRRGWPEFAAQTADIATAFAGTGPATAPVMQPAPMATTGPTETLVAFVDRNGSRPRPPAGSWNGELPIAPPPVVTPDLPSSLVSLEPRPEARHAEPAAPEPDSEISIPTPPPSLQSEPPAPATPPPLATPPPVAPREPTVQGVDVALAIILPALQQQRGAAPSLPAARQDVVRWLRGAIGSTMAAAAITVVEAERDHLERLAFDALFGLGPLDALMREDAVSAIFVNGPRSVFVERQGRLEPARVEFRDARELDGVVERLAMRAGIASGAGRDPLIDRRLEDGTRVIVVMPPLAPAGPCLVIRRPRTRSVTLESLVAEGALSPQMAAVLRLAVRSRLNLLVCGAPDCGKTALLAALARAAPAEARIVTIEATAELRPEVPHHVALLAPADSGVAPARALAAALALRPDRLLIDDLAEAVVSGIASAAAVGIEGIAASVAAATPPDALQRLEAALRTAEATLSSSEVRRRLAHAFELVVHLERQRDGVRRVTHLADLAIEGEAVVCRDLFAFDQGAGRFIATGLRPSFLPHVARAGLESALLDVL